MDTAKLVELGTYPFFAGLRRREYLRLRLPGWSKVAAIASEALSRYEMYMYEEAPYEYPRSLS